MLLPLPGPPVEPVDLGVGVGLIVAVIAAAVAVPWDRVRPMWQTVPALTALVAVALLRDASGGASGGLAVLLLLPVVWMALYGDRTRLAIVISGVAVAIVVPLVVVGAPKYPAGGWRSAVLFVALSAVAGNSVQRLVDRSRRDAARLRDRDRERERLLARVEVLAVTDALTGLANRRAWDQRLELLAPDMPARVSLAMLDLDGFKALNDARGHMVGDQALRASAAAWRSVLRPEDLLARLGGDEFGLLLPDCALQDARDVVERMRAATLGGITCSAGVAEWDGHEAIADLVARADALLYGAKRSGGNVTSAAGVLT